MVQTQLFVNTVPALGTLFNFQDFTWSLTSPLLKWCETYGITGRCDSWAPRWNFQRNAVTDQRIVFDLAVRLTVEFPQGREAHHPIWFPSSTAPTHTNTHTHTHTGRWSSHTGTHTYTHSLGMLGKIALIYYCHTPSSRPRGSAGAPPKHVFRRQCHTITS